MNRKLTGAAILLLAGWIIVGSSGCEQDKTALAALPAPQIVSQVAPVDSAANLYYLVGWRNDFEEILQKLLRNGVEVQRAWIPVYDSPCECATCVSAMVVEITPGTGTELLEALGFVTDAEPWVINCGIAEYKFYEV